MSGDLVKERGTRAGKRSRVARALSLGPRWLSPSVAILVTLSVPGLAPAQTPTPTFSTVVEPEGTAFPVHTPRAGNQSIPEVASNEDGRFVVTWRDVNPANAQMIGARIYDSAGQPQSPELVVNTYSTSQRNYPSVAVAPDGDFLVVWSGSTTSQASNGLVGRFYSSSGTAPGSEFRINQDTLASAHPAVAAQSDGDFLVVWDTGTTGELQGRIVDRLGVPAGSQFVVNSSTTGYQFTTAVARTADDSFIVVWGRLLSSLSEGAILGRKVDSNGTPIGSEFLVSESTLAAGSPKLAVAPNGSFMAVWLPGVLSSGQSHGRLFNSAGSAIGSEFSASSNTSNPELSVDIHADVDNVFIVTWNELNQSNFSFPIRGRIVDSLGNAASLPFAIRDPNSVSVGLSTAVLPGGRFVATYAAAPDALNGDIQARLFARRSSDLSVSLFSSNDTVSPGSPFFLAMLVDNAGPLDAAAVHVDVTLPSQFVFDHASADSGSCTAGGSGAICTLDVVFVDDFVLVLIDGHVRADATPGAVNVVADVEPRLFEALLSDNTDSLPLTIVAATPTRTPTRTRTPSRTPTGPTATLTRTHTPTRTASPSGPSATPTQTSAVLGVPRPGLAWPALLALAIGLGALATRIRRAGT